MLKNTCPGTLSPLETPTPSWTPKSIKKSTENKVQQQCVKIQAQRPQNEHSDALGSQNGSKMDPKMEPKVVQKESLHKNMKNLIFACIYYTSGMSLTSKNDSFFDVFWMLFRYLFRASQKVSKKDL